MEGKIKANFDTTYCINEECDQECYRHHTNYEFEENENYWFTECCHKYLERKSKGEIK